MLERAKRRVLRHILPYGPSEIDRNRIEYPPMNQNSKNTNQLTFGSWDPVSPWEQPDRVARFADREPDRRLSAWMKTVRSPAAVRVLDLGCAGGRNTEALTRAGFDVYAVDASRAMVEKTRERLADVIGDIEAKRRVIRGFMEDLSRFPDEEFDMVVALGIYHNADSPARWEAALDESIRVLKNGGKLLTACFSPASQPRGEALQPVSGSPDLYEGFSSSPMVMVEADTMDREFKKRGMTPCVPTETVRRDTGDGFRITVNAFYCKE